MEQNKKQIIEYLDNNSIHYKEYLHKAVYTVEEAKNIDINIPGAHTKNLFLKNEKSDEYFLVVILASKRADLKEIANILGVKRLTFGKPDKLQEYLHLTPGSVSPFGLINDKNAQVQVLIDSDIYTYTYVNFHPNVNTSTLSLSIKEFKKYLETLTDKVKERAL